MKRYLGPLAIAAMLLLTPAAAQAGTVTGGDADWGFKASFRSYILNVPVAGTITTSQGATTNGDGTFNFPNASGSYSPGAGTGDIPLEGRVVFSKPTHGISITMENPRITLDGAAGVLYADLSGAQGGAPNTPLANLDLGAVTPVDDGSSATFTAVPATITAEGGAVFNYSEGEALDPLSFAVTYAEGPAGKIKAAKKQAKVKGKGKVDLAKVTCQVSACKVKAPKKVKATLKGGKGGKGKKQTIKPKLKAPKNLAQYDEGSVVAKLSGKDAKKLAGRKATLEAEIVLSGDGQTVTRTVKVKLKGKK